jgi:hypothetical protein
MQSFWQEFRSFFSLSRIAIGVILSLVTTALSNLVLKALGIKPVRRWLLWSSLFLLILVLLLFFRGGQAGSVQPRLEARVIGLPNPQNKHIPNQTPVIAVISVRNSGPPTILEGWSLKIKWHDESTDSLVPVIFPQTVDMLDMNRKVHYTKIDSLVDKSLLPKATGAMVRGVAI